MDLDKQTDKDMEEKEKAKELVDNFYNCSEMNMVQAKKCALLCVNSILEVISPYDNDMYYTINYWEEVKKELESL